jgi:Domain of unknown function (DUF4349)
MNESSKRRWFKRRGVIVAALVAAVVLAVAAVIAVHSVATRDAAVGPDVAVVPGGYGSDPGKLLPAETSAVTSSDAEARTGSGDSSVPSVTTNEVSAALAPLDPTRFLVQTGDMTLYVAKGQVPSVAGRITALADALRGYVLQSYVMSGVDGQKPSATITMRVPAQNYQEAIRRIAQMGQVKALQTGAEDVTGQYVDIRARLAHYRAVERRLLTFLAKATSINQALAIQQRIDQTQLTVEELTAQVKAMREQITYGTLTVSVTEKPGKPVAASEKQQTFLAAFVHSAKLLSRAARALFVALGATIPFLVLIAVLGWLGWMAARRLGLLRPHRGSQSIEVHS